MESPTKEELAYMAGAMDSDGFFTIKRGTYAIRVTKDSHNPTYYERVGIKQVQPEAIELIHKYFRGYKGIQKPAKNVKNGKMLYSLEIRNVQAHIFVVAIFPYLRLKKKQAEILLALRKSNEEVRKGTRTIIQKGRWGEMEATHKVASEEQLAYRENLLQQIKKLNDSRNDASHQPKPWK